MPASNPTLLHSLLQALPPNARRVLELSPCDSELGAQYRALWPDVSWHRHTALPGATPPDGMHYDWVVVDPRAQIWRDGAAGLEALHGWTTPGAQLLCGLPNMAHHDALQRLAMGDFTADDGGALDAAHARLFTPASAYKQLLDAGWLPHMPTQCRTEVPESVFSARLIGAAMALGVPRATVQRNLGLQHMVIVCGKGSLNAPAESTRYAPFSVIVPVNRPLELALNIERSPGLREVNAQIITIEGASSAADAFEQGARQAGCAWRVFVHQDVYFPSGSGFMLAEQLGALEADGRYGAPVGFAGLEAGADLRSGLRYAGQVIDRTQRFDHAASSCGVSVDEFAVALHSASPVALDPALGWHLWATDLCLQAYALGGAPCAEILRVALFHNSTTGYELPAEFHDSAALLLQKYPGLDEIPTLCGALKRQLAAAA
jgi:hypothetical protein